MVFVSATVVSSRSLVVIIIQAGKRGSKKGTISYKAVEGFDYICVRGNGCPLLVECLCHFVGVWRRGTLASL